MREEIKRLYESSECILSSGYSFLFVSDFEKNQYKELYGEREDLDQDICEIVLDTEFKELSELAKKDKKPWGYDSALEDRYGYAPKERIDMMKQVLKFRQKIKKNEQGRANQFSELFEKLDEDSQKIIIYLMQRLEQK